MEGNYPVNQTGEAYVKVKEKKSGRGIFVLFIIIILLVAVFYFFFGDESGKLKGLINGLLKNQTEESTESTTTPSTVQTETTEDIYKYDISTLMQGQTAVIPRDMSAFITGEKYYNDSGYTINGFSTYKTPLLKGTVLVLCTHPYEAYLSEGTLSVADGYEVNIGEECVAKAAVSLCDELNGLGINAVYLDTENTSAYSSYQNAYNKISQYLQNDKSVCLIIDIHRGTETDEEGLLCPVTLIDGKVCAQVQLDVGTDALGQENDGWRDSLTLANTLTDTANAKYGTLFRPTYISASRLNQHIGIPTFTCEIGTCWNTLNQAQNASVALSRAVAGLFYDTASE